MKTYAEITAIQEQILIEASHAFAKLVTKTVVDPEQHLKVLIDGATVNAAGQIIRPNGAHAAAATDYARSTDGSILSGTGVNYVSYENFQLTRKKILEGIIDQLHPGNLMHDLSANILIAQLPHIGNGAPAAPVVPFVPVLPAGVVAQPAFAATTTRAEVNFNAPNSSVAAIDGQGTNIHNLVKSILNTAFTDTILTRAKEYIGTVFGCNFLDPVHQQRAAVFGYAAQIAKDRYVQAFDNPAINNLLDDAAGSALANCKTQLRLCTQAANITEAVTPPAAIVPASAVFFPRADEIADKIAEFVFHQLDDVNKKAADIIKKSLQGFIVKADIKTIAGPASIDTVKAEIPDAALEAAKKLVETQSAVATAALVRAAANVGLLEISALSTAANNATPADAALIKLLDIRRSVAAATLAKMDAKILIMPGIAASELLKEAAIPTDDQKHQYLENLLIKVKEAGDSKDPAKAKDPNVFSALKDLSGLLLKNYGKDIFSNQQLTSLQGNLDSLLDVLDKAAQNSSNKTLPVGLASVAAGVAALGAQLGAQRDFTVASIVIIVVDVVVAVAAPLITHYAVDKPQNKKTDVNTEIAVQLKEQLKNEAKTKASYYINTSSSIFNEHKTKNTKETAPNRFATFTDELAASNAAMAKGGV